MKQYKQRFLHSRPETTEYTFRLRSYQIAEKKKQSGAQLLSRGVGDQIFEHIEQAREPQS